MRRARLLSAAIMAFILLPGLLSPIASAASQPSSLPYVKYTVVLGNNTRFNGNFVPHNVIAASQGEAAVAYDSRTGDLYVTNLLDNITVLNANTLSEIKTLNVGGEPFDLIYDHNNGYVYSSNLNQNLSVIDGKKMEVIASISTGTYSSRMALNYNTNTIYMQALLTLTYEKIDLNSNAPSGNVSVGNFNGTFHHPVPGIAYDTANNTIFSSNYENSTVVALNATTGRVLVNITLPAQAGGIFYDPGNNSIYAAVPLTQQVFIINASSYRIENKLDTQAYPSSISVAEGQNYIFVTNEESGTLSVYNLTTCRLLETLNLSSGSTGALYVPETGYLYVVNSGAGTLSAVHVTHPENSRTIWSSFFDTVVLVIGIGGIILAVIAYRRVRK